MIVHAHMHDDALLTHLEHHVERIFGRIVEHFVQCDQVGMIELLHDGNLLANEIERVAILDDVLHVRGSRGA